MLYAVTINSNKIDKSIEPGTIDCILEYRAHVNSCTQLGNVGRCYYEVGKQGRAHVHFTLDSSRELTKEEIKKALYKEGFYYDCRPVRDIGAWNTYIRKDQPKEVKKSLFRKSITTVSIKTL